jgi:hypothetical protein
MACGFAYARSPKNKKIPAGKIARARKQSAGAFLLGRPKKIKRKKRFQGLPLLNHKANPVRTPLVGGVRAPMFSEA